MDSVADELSTTSAPGNVYTCLSTTPNGPNGPDGPNGVWDGWDDDALTAMGGSASEFPSRSSPDDDFPSS